MNLTREEFLKKYNISEEEFREAGLSWEDLLEIARDYQSKIPKYDKIRRQFIAEFFMYREKETGLQSYRGRMKDPEHLLEKIIRKRKENYMKYRSLTKENYAKFVMDLIGVRGLLLYREDWVVFHKYLISHFQNDPRKYVKDCIKDYSDETDGCIVEPPKVHMRLGDYADIYFNWISRDNILDQKHYRSVHYIVKYEGVYIEIQIRTLFEEGWGEIDHHIIYPYKKDDPMLNEFSELLNRLSGMGDEMASFYKRLQVVPDQAFQRKDSVVNHKIMENTFDGDLHSVDLKKILTVEDAIKSVLNE